MHPVIVSLITLAVLSGISLICLFGDQPQFKGSWIFVLRRWMVSQLSKLNGGFRRFDLAFCNGMLYKFFVLRMYVVYLWIPPAMYVVLMAISLHEFFVHGYSQLEGPSTLTVLNVHITLMVNFYSFIMAIVQDPGDISHWNAEKLESLTKSRFPYNEIIFFNHELYGQKSKNICGTCKILKLPRSKHCSVCDKCFVLFDHHCIWLNRCVAYYNYKYFLTFLSSLIWILICGAYLNFVALLKHKTTQISWLDLILHTDTRNERVGALMVICILLAPLIMWFSSEHLQFIYLGMTTNESAKWDFVRYLADNGILFYYNTNGTNDKYLIVQDQDGKFYRLADDQRIDNVNRSNLQQVSNMGSELDNVYDSGFWGNLRERIFTERL